MTYWQYFSTKHGLRLTPASLRSPTLSSPAAERGLKSFVILNEAKNYLLNIVKNLLFNRQSL